MSATDWRDATYNETYSSTLLGLENRKKVDAQFSAADAEGVLKHLYIQDGNDWLGRGELQDAILGATIAAYEHFIHEWKAASPQPSEQE